MNLRPPAWLWTALALALGLALRVWFIIHAPRITNDSLLYGNIARNWMVHGVYSFAGPNGVVRPTLIRLPGYPLFLASCFRLFGLGNYTAILYLQAAVDLGSCLLASALSGRLFGARARLITLWLGAVCPFTAAYAAAALTETITLFAIILAFYGFDRWRSAGAAFNRWLWPFALALAYSLLLRPEQGLLAAAMLPAMLHVAWRSSRSPLRTLLPTLTAALIVLLPLLPWTIRNERTFHIFQPLAPRQAIDPGETPPLGFQRWFRTWAVDYAATEDVYWNYDGAPIELADLPARAFGIPSQQAATTELLTEYNQTANPTPEFDARFNALAEARIAAAPARYYLALPLARMMNMLLRPRTETMPNRLEWWRFHEHPGESVFAVFYILLDAVYLVLAAWGAILWRRTRVHKPLLYAMLAFIALRCALLLTMDNSEPRYTLEFFPILFILAAIPFAEANGSLPASFHSA